MRSTNNQDGQTIPLHQAFDFIGIGIGPFNLGLAALAHGIPSLKCAFFDEKPSFEWHPGLLLANAKMQVPFYADLVTLADPTSPFSYLNFLKENRQIFRFAILEDNFPTRAEYAAYCKWVAGQLSGLHFSHRCEAVHYDKKENLYQVTLRIQHLARHDNPTSVPAYSHKVVFARFIVIGVGSCPYLPSFVEPFLSEDCFHSTDYVFHRQRLLQKSSIALIGSGQSGAEIFYDLLQQGGPFKSLYWITRSARFFPMDYSKFALEMATPDYIDFFYSLPPDKKGQLLQSQDELYKGVNASLLADIYALLDRQAREGSGHAVLWPNRNLLSIARNNGFYELEFLHLTDGQTSLHQADSIIFSTGYRPRPPDFLYAVKELICYDASGRFAVHRNYSIDLNHSLFVQNAELHTHGFNAPDLGLGPYRNAVILNTILGREHFRYETGSSFQRF